MFARFLKRLSRDLRGVGALEFALCAPVFMMLVFGIVQFGWTQHEFSSIRFAMERASRSLMINPNTTQSQLQTLVNGYLQGTTKTTVTVALSSATTAQGKIATVSTNYTAVFGAPQLASFSIPYNVTINVPLR